MTDIKVYIAPIDSPGDALVAEPKWEFLGVAVKIETPDVIWKAETDE